MVPNSLCPKMLKKQYFLSPLLKKWYPLPFRQEKSDPPTPLSPPKLSVPLYPTMPMNTRCPKQNNEYNIALIRTKLITFGKSVCLSIDFEIYGLSCSIASEGTVYKDRLFFHDFFTFYSCDFFYYLFRTFFCFC
jgi:hypothetical protein